MVKMWVHKEEAVNNLQIRDVDKGKDVIGISKGSKQGSPAKKPKPNWSRGRND